MIELKESPAKIHTVYNPVLFKLKSQANSNASVCIVIDNTDNTTVRLDVKFNEKGEAIINLADILKSLFGTIDEVKEAALIIDDFQSIQYSLLVKERVEQEQSENGNTIINLDEYSLLGKYTAVRSVAQVAEKQDLTQQHGKLLTGFDKLIVYDGYPRDGSILKKVDDSFRIIRKQARCDMSVFPEAEFTCTAEWSFSIDEAGARDFVCQEIITPGSPNVNTGNTLSFVLIYKSYINGVEENSITYDLLDAFGTFPRIRQYEYSPYTDEQVRTRTNALIDYIGKCINFQLLNDVIKRDIDHCPVPFIRVMNGGIELTNGQVDGCCNTDYNIVIETSGESWQVQSSAAFVSVLPNVGMANSNAEIRIEPNDTGTARYAELRFVLINRPEIGKTIIINQLGCGAPPYQAINNYITWFANWNEITNQIECTASLDYPTQSDGLIVMFDIRLDGSRNVRVELLFGANKRTAAKSFQNADFITATSIEMKLQDFNPQWSDDSSGNYRYYYHARTDESIIKVKG